jgi:hypothetical protein
MRKINFVTHSKHRRKREEKQESKKEKLRIINQGIEEEYN